MPIIDKWTQLKDNALILSLKFATVVLIYNSTTSPQFTSTSNFPYILNPAKRLATGKMCINSERLGSYHSRFTVFFTLKLNWNLRSSSNIQSAVGCGNVCCVISKACFDLQMASKYKYNESSMVKRASANTDVYVWHLCVQLCFRFYYLPYSFFFWI
jgi:hypothetical protein